MTRTFLILLLFVGLVSCALSSYLDIPPPPVRPLRFKTREQIETYLKAVKDYYDAFKIKLVRRNSPYIDDDFLLSIGRENENDSDSDSSSENVYRDDPMNFKLKNFIFRKRSLIKRSAKTR